MGDVYFDQWFDQVIDYLNLSLGKGNYALDRHAAEMEFEENDEKDPEDYAAELIEEWKDA
jgi:hypothetical protein